MAFIKGRRRMRPLNRDQTEDPMFPEGAGLIDGMIVAEDEKDEADMMEPQLEPIRKPVVRPRKVRKVRKGMKNVSFRKKPKRKVRKMRII